MEEVSTAAVKEKEKQDSRLVAQHNYLIRSYLSFGLIEARIFTLMLATIGYKEKELKEIKIKLADVVPYSLNGTVYKQVKQACEDLFNKEINLAKVGSKKKDFHKVRIVQELELDSGTGYIKGYFADRIKPYLLQLKDNFTLSEIQLLMTLKSSYSHRLYWLLKSYESLGKYTESIVELKKLLLGEDAETKYKDYFDFKRVVLEPAFTEVKTVLNISYKPLKTGKKVTDILFIFDNESSLIEKAAPKKSKNPIRKVAKASLPDMFAAESALSDLLESITDLQERKDVENAYRSMTSKGLSSESAIFFLSRIPAQDIHYQIYHKYTLKKDSIKDSAAYINTVLSNLISKE
ncbi:replication initiation protein [Pontibacter harenae]|uniref:replication initiation protein n=1 Tax=Pontibacter harenae TaxID=2894083 RepID=UPI001E294C5D|nr:replication initiation protein [Pontibacter harenae]MCC9167893.1 replication initiation protein [Pontibacter harenae]